MPAGLPIAHMLHSILSCPTKLFSVFTASPSVYYCAVFQARGIVYSHKTAGGFVLGERGEFSL